MSQDNVEIVRHASAPLTKSMGAEVIENRLSDAALGEFVDPGVEWVPDPQSLLGSTSYRGFEGIRSFWGALISVWDDYLIETEEILDAGEQVVTITRVSARTHDLEIEDTWSALYTLREGKIVRVDGFLSREGALEAAGLRE